MKIINRGFIIVRAKQAMIDWCNQFEDEFVMDEGAEPTVYLIEEDFIDEEPLLKQHYKSIFLNELSAVNEDDSEYPEIKLEVFQDWFEIEFGTSVFDTQKSNITAL